MLATAQEFLDAARLAGIILASKDGRLQLRSTGPISDAIKLAARTFKADILALLAGSNGPGAAPHALALPDTIAPATAGSPGSTVFVDLETRSVCNLKAEGGPRYAAHPTTEILMAAAVLDGLVLLW